LTQGRDPFPSAEALREAAARPAAPSSRAEIVIPAEPPPPEESPSKGTTPVSIRPLRHDVSLAIRDVLLMLGIATIVAALLWVLATIAWRHTGASGSDHRSSGSMRTLAPCGIVKIE
jgi:hypothetical protein